jgi:hypothetical protein
VTIQTITLNVTNDAIVETGEQFTVNLSGAVNSTISDNQGIGSITDNDTNTFSIADVSIAEGNTGTQNMTFTVTRTGTSDVPIALSYATSNGSATAGSDYTTTTGTVTFAAGTGGTQTFTVPITGDTANELNETFTVTLTPQNANQVSGVSDLVAIGTITNDDVADTTAPTVTLTANPGNVAGNTNTTITFQFSEAVTGFAVNDVTVTAGTIVAGTFTQVDADTYTLVVTRTANGNNPMTVVVAGLSYTDLASNSGSGGSVEVRRDAPAGTAGAPINLALETPPTVDGGGVDIVVTGERGHITAGRLLGRTDPYSERTDDYLAVHLQWSAAGQCHDELGERGRYVWDDPHRQQRRSLCSWQSDLRGVVGRQSHWLRWQ